EGVEQELEGRVRLRPVLRAEADQYHPPLADLQVDDRGAPLQELPPFEVAAHQDVLGVFRVGGDDAAVDAGAGGAGLEGRRVGEVGRRLGLHAVGEGVGGVE